MADTPQSAPGAASKPEAKTEAKPETKGEAKPEAKGEAKPGAKEAPKGETAPKSAPGGGLFLLIGVVVGALAIGGAGGAFLIGPQIVAARDSKVPAKAAPATGKAAGSAPKAAVYRLDNLVVNPAGSQGTRFLMAAVAFELPDDKIEAHLRDHDAEVRDAVMRTLESQTLEMLTRPGARDSLKRQLGTAVAPLAGDIPWMRVYLPQFVIQ